jgi:hypothetical protein
MLPPINGRIIKPISTRVAGPSLTMQCPVQLGGETALEGGPPAPSLPIHDPTPLASCVGKVATGATALADLVAPVGEQALAMGSRLAADPEGGIQILRRLVVEANKVAFLLDPTAAAGDPEGEFVLSSPDREMLSGSD